MAACSSNSASRLPDGRPVRTVFLDFATLHPDDLDTQALSTTLESVEFWSDSRADELSLRLADAEVAVVNKLQLRDEHFAAAPGLKLVCLLATGSDNVDLEAAARHNVAVANIRDYCTPSVVQHVFALITHAEPAARRTPPAGAGRGVADGREFLPAGTGVCRTARQDAGPHRSRRPGQRRGRCGTRLRHAGRGGETAMARGRSAVG